ncbi:hypothetical protein SUDANB120_02790 [Streptomyces sp. enrichment culture]|uniref:hypothetical protein n=1 Tax=Streptomyces sp. enrichment culture TaxID=1795815 RepID=UPI003F579234
MAELSAAEPARVHAVVVGIEHFGRVPDRGWDLPGAAADAMRFTRWLRRRGVPAENITLMLAPVPAAQAAFNAEARALGIDVRFVVSRDHIMDGFRPRSEASEGDLLYVYWGGHGVLDHGDRRLLLCPDAHDADQRCVDLHQLREYLTRPDVVQFPQQVFLVDACATFREVNSGPSGPAVAAFPAGPRQAVDQFLLLAAAIGQAALQDEARDTGAFSDAVLTWLEERSPGLAPDLAALSAHLEEHFDGSGPDGSALQTPVTMELLAPGGRAKVVSLRPPAGPAPKAEPPAGRGTAATAPEARRRPRRGGLVTVVAAAALVVAAAAGDTVYELMVRAKDGADGKAAAAGAAAPGAASPPASPSPSPSPSPSASASPSGSAAASPPATPPAAAAPTPSVQPAGAPKPVCASTQATYAGPEVTASPCYVLEGGRVTMVAQLRASKPVDVTVHLWLTEKDETRHLYPTGSTVQQTLRAGTEAKEVRGLVGIALAPGAYDVHVAVTRKGEPAPSATNPTVTGRSQGFSYP